MNRYKSILLICSIVFLIDQLSKHLVTFFDLPMTFNSGISFNFLSVNNATFLSMILLLITSFLFFSFTKIWAKNYLAAGLFFGGALANIFDRFIFGSVRDWLTIPFLEIKNNLADWSIFFGLLILIVSMFSTKSKKNKKL